MGRPPCCDRSNVKRGLWTPEEDAKILAYVSTHGTGNWSLVPKKAGLNRCGKSCRLRWTNYLRPDLKHDTFTPQEEELIIKLHKAIGSRWSWIAKQLPGRTDNDVKNYWNTKLKKKLRSMGIDPITHKPISQILTDFGNINESNNIPNMSLTTNLTISKQEDDYSANFSDLATATISNLVTTNSMSEEQTIHENSSAFSAFFQPFFFNEATNSSCSSSNSSATFAQLSPQPQSYSCQQQQQQQHQDQATVLPSSSSFMWSEFLLGNPVSDAELNGLFMSSTCSSTLPQNNGVSYCKFTTGNGDQNFNRSIGHGHEGCGDHVSGNDQANYYGSGDPTCASSFVDGILDKDREMSSQFPEILDPSFD